MPRGFQCCCFTTSRLKAILIYSLTEEAGVNALSHLDTTNFSAMLERMGVTEMGRKYDIQNWFVTLSTRVTMAVNHDAGSTPS